MRKIKNNDFMAVKMESKNTSGSTSVIIETHPVISSGSTAQVQRFKAIAKYSGK